MVVTVPPMVVPSQQAPGGISTPLPVAVAAGVTVPKVLDGSMPITDYAPQPPVWAGAGPRTSLMPPNSVPQPMQIPGARIPAVAQLLQQGGYGFGRLNGLGSGFPRLPRFGRLGAFGLNVPQTTLTTGGGGSAPVTSAPSSSGNTFSTVTSPSGATKTIQITPMVNPSSAPVQTATGLTTQQASAATYQAQAATIQTAVQQSSTPLINQGPSTFYSGSNLVATGNQAPAAPAQTPTPLDTTTNNTNVVPVPVTTIGPAQGPGGPPPGGGAGVDTTGQQQQPPPPPPVVCGPGYVISPDGKGCNVMPPAQCDPGFMFAADGVTCIPTPTSQSGGDTTDSGGDSGGGAPAAAPAASPDAQMAAAATGVQSMGTTAPIFTAKNVALVGGVGALAYFLFFV